MPFTRAYEEHELSGDTRRIFADMRQSFDLPFIPTMFKVLAAKPQYLRVMWDDLGTVARSREFHSASAALRELAHSQAVQCGWRFSDQQRILSGQKFSSQDIEILAEVVGIISRALAQMTVFTRLMQRGYSGGQRGRVSAASHASALARLLTLHVPNEREAGLRAWLIYSDFKRTTGLRQVFSAYRVLAPYPGYLASVWLESKKILNEPSLKRAREEVAQRSLSLLAGLPVGDHRRGRGLSPADWREVEETVDTMARSLPQFLLVNAAWERAFPQQGRMRGAA